MIVQQLLRPYSEREAAHLSGLSRYQIRRCRREGLLSGGGEARGWLSFDDLVVLKAAKSLLEADLSPRRVRSALRRLRAELPEGEPLSSLRIAVEGSSIVVSDGEVTWNPESGQTLLELGSRLEAEPVTETGVEPDGRQMHLSAVEWFERACELEAEAPKEAVAAYRRSLELDEQCLEAHVNLGRLLHEARDLRGAESHYRRALEIDAEDATAAFNLGVVLEDLGRREAALEAYEAALATDAELRDAAHNALRLYEQIGDRAGALRLLKKLRRSG